MKKGSTIFLQTVLVLLGIGVLAFLLWEPWVEGVNAHATFTEVYFDDPFLACAYATSLLFFVPLYQAYKLLGRIRRNEVFSQSSVSALRTIKRCATALAAVISAAVAYLFIVRPGDDIAGGVAMGLFIFSGSVVAATAAATFERLLQSAVDMKSENDLTV